MSATLGVPEAALAYDKALAAFGLGEADETAVLAAESELSAAKRRHDAANAAIAETARREEAAAKAQRSALIKAKNAEIGKLLRDRERLVRKTFSAINTLADSLDALEANGEDVGEIRRQFGLHRGVNWPNGNLNDGVIIGLRRLATERLKRFGFVKVDGGGGWAAEGLLEKALADVTLDDVAVRDE